MIDSMPYLRRIPTHIGVIPDGNRRWAVEHGLSKEQGYARGVAPGKQLCETCIALGVQEVTFYGFTHDNTKRPAVQREAFQQACVQAVESLKGKDIDIRVIGNTASKMFPDRLRSYAKSESAIGASLKVNILVNYSWQWDVSHAVQSPTSVAESWLGRIGSACIPRVDLLIRWGGHRRLSGFLPIQCVYSDFYVVDAMWPDFTTQHVYDALGWYQEQDVTLGG